jgi:hypothetical protein
MRSFEENFGWLADASSRHDISIVVSTFSHRGGKVFGDLSAVRARSLIASNITDVLPPSWLGGGLFEHLPGLRQQAMSRAFEDRLTPEMIKRAIPNAVVHIEEKIEFGWFEKPQFALGAHTARDPFSMQMLYKIFQADLLRQNLEIQSGSAFDIIVRMRPDRPLSGLDDGLLESIRPGELYVEVARKHDRFLGDQFAVADSQTMQIYSQFFLHAYLKAKKGNWVGIHNELYEYVEHAGLKVRSYNPMMDFAPDKLLDVSDLVSALRRRGKNPSLGLFGYTPKSSKDTNILIKSVELVDLIWRGEYLLESEHSLLQLSALLDVFNPERDSGVFHYIAANLSDGLPFETRLLCIFMSFSGIPDPNLLQAVYSYTFEFCVQFEGLAKNRGAIPVNPSELVSFCLALANPGPLHGLIAGFLSSADWRACIEAGLGALLNHLLAKDPGFWLRIARHMHSAGELEQAEHLLRLTLLHSAGHCSSWLELGFVLCSGNRASEAHAPAYKAAALEPEHAEVQNLASMLLLRAGDIVGAEQLARQALRIDPHNLMYQKQLKDVSTSHIRLD